MSHWAIILESLRHSAQRIGTDMRTIWMVQMIGNNCSLVSTTLMIRYSKVTFTDETLFLKVKPLISGRGICACKCIPSWWSLELSLQYSAWELHMWCIHIWSPLYGQMNWRGRLKKPRSDIYNIRATFWTWVCRLYRKGSNMPIAMNKAV